MPSLDHMKRLSKYILEGDMKAAEELFLLLKRYDFGSEACRIFSFDEGDVFGYTPERFRGQEGCEYRLSFGWWPGSEVLSPEFGTSPRFYEEIRHWDASGHRYILNRGGEYSEMFGPGRRVAGTAVVSWPVDPMGRLIPGDISKYRVMSWVLTPPQISKIREIHKEFHLGKFDVILRCDNERFQNFIYMPAKRNIFAEFQGSSGIKSSIYGDIVRKVHYIISNIRSYLGQDIKI